ncbi:MAG TPA: Holliday junction resolvase RuvX [Candidatus Binataceae bacterium]|nr:Holliday junction resolvase RuvX [Candidatus Binataceae bacterium]
MILGVDYGRRRIGLAILHGDGLVLPLTTIQQVSRKDSLVRIGRYVAEFECRQVIVGLPANADASKGTSAQAAERFAEELRQTLSVTVELHDERLSSFEARERMRDLPRGRAPGQDDALAACVILESWWQQHKG